MMCKNLDGKIWQIFGQSLISPNFSEAKVSLHMVLVMNNLENLLAEEF